MEISSWVVFKAFFSPLFFKLFFVFVVVAIVFGFITRKLDALLEKIKKNKKK